MCHQPKQKTKNQKRRRNDWTTSPHWSILVFERVCASFFAREKSNSSIYIHELNEFGNIFCVFFSTMGVINSSFIHWILFHAFHRGKKIKSRKQLTTQFFTMIFLSFPNLLTPAYCCYCCWCRLLNRWMNTLTLSQKVVCNFNTSRTISHLRNEMMIDSDDR